jgi:hypothetical protein
MHTIYSRFLLPAILFASVCSISALAQTKSVSDTLLPLFVEHKAGELHNYVFSEETQIKRVHSDGSERQFKREIIYYFSQVAPKPAIDGFANVITTVDSMRYRFTEDGNIVEYHSTQPEKPNLKFFDLLYATVPMNRTFEMTISPYGDVAKVSGEMVEWLREYTTVQGKDILAPIQKFLWLDGISDNNLRHFGDLSKGIIPNGKVKRDSIWDKNISFRMNNIDFSGLAKANVTSVREGLYTIHATADELSATPGETRLYGITEMLKLNTGKGKTEFTVELSENEIRRMEARSTSVLNATIQKETFNEYITQNLSWKLTGKTQW